VGGDEERGCRGVDRGEGGGGLGNFDCSTELDWACGVDAATITTAVEKSDLNESQQAVLCEGKFGCGLRRKRRRRRKRRENCEQGMPHARQEHAAAAYQHSLCTLVRIGSDRSSSHAAV